MSHEDVTVGFPIVGKRYIVSIFETLDERRSLKLLIWYFHSRSEEHSDPESSDKRIKNFKLANEQLKKWRF